MDVCQQVFLEFYAKKNNFPDNDQALPILCGFAKNLINQLIKNKKRIYCKDNDNQIIGKFEQQNNQNGGEGSENLIPSIKRIIKKLPKKKALALHYYLFSGISEEEITNILKYKNVKVFQVVVSKAKKQFVQEIKKEENHQLLDDCLKSIKKRL